MKWKRCSSEPAHLSSTHLSGTPLLSIPRSLGGSRINCVTMKEPFGTRRSSESLNRIAVPVPCVRELYGIWLGFFSLIFKKVLRMFSCRETLQHKLGSFRNIVSSYLLGGSSFSSLPFSDSFPQPPHFHKWGRMGNLMLLGNRVRMCNYGLPNNFFACVFDVRDPWCLRAAHFPVPCFGMY